MHMVGCKVSNNTALGDANKFVSRCLSTTYPSPILTMISPVTGILDTSGATPITVKMQISVGVIGNNDVRFGYDWGTLTGWCISWGDGTQNSGTFGSPQADSEGFLYAIATASHTYHNLDDPATSYYFSDGFRPWATVSDSCGNSISTDYGRYIYVCRSDAVPDKIGGCGYPETPELPPLEPPKTVCTAGDTICVGTAGFLCDWEGVWTFEPTITTQCMRNFNAEIGFPTTCVENNFECRNTAMYKCVNGEYVPTGESCGVTSEPVKDSHGCIISEGYAWCPVLTRCVKPEVTACIGGVVIPETPVSETPIYQDSQQIQSGTEIPMQTIMIVGAVILGALLISGGKKK